MKISRRLFVMLFVLLLLVVASPVSNPVHVEETSAASYAYNKYAEFWLDDMNQWGLWKVKVAVQWSTQDPWRACALRYKSSPDNTSQARFTNTPYCYPLYGPYIPQNHFYKSSITRVECWVAASPIATTIVIDNCGQLADPQNYDPYYFTVGARFRVCIGIYNTPFVTCFPFITKMHILGSSVWVWNTSGG